MQAVRRALDEIVLKKRPPALPPKVPKLKNIQPLEPPRPGQRQLELVFVHECRSDSSPPLTPCIAAKQSCMREPGVGQAAQEMEAMLGHQKPEDVLPGRYHGCNSAACVLCKHNPAKRCTGNFAHKYWVGDKLLAKCEGTIMVELIDAETGARMTDEVQGMKIEVRPRADQVVLTEFVINSITKEEASTRKEGNTSALTAHAQAWH